MNERERDLIAALAEGSLEDETEARALLESSAEARAEYQLQLAALEALSGVGPAAMTETERARLHRDLWAQLRAEAAKSRSTTGIYGWSLAAAALFVVVGLAAVLGGGVLDRAGDDAAMEAVAERSDATVAAAEASDAPAAGEESATSQIAQQYFSEEAERLRSGDDLSREADGDPVDQDCLASAGLTDHEVAAVLNEDGSAPVEGRYLAAVPAGESIGPQTPIHFVERDTCELVYTDD